MAANQLYYVDADGRRLPTQEVCDAIAKDDAMMRVLRKFNDVQAAQRLFNARRDKLNGILGQLALQQIADEHDLMTTRLYLFDIIRRLGISPEYNFPVVRPDAVNRRQQPPAAGPVDIPIDSSHTNSHNGANGQQGAFVFAPVAWNQNAMSNRRDQVRDEAEDVSRTSEG